MANNNANTRMGNTHQTFWQFWQEVGQGIGKFFIWIIYITIGVVVKITFESQTNKLSKRKIAIKVILSVCAGAIASITCSKLGQERLGAIIVPVVTLIGEGLFGYIIANWEKWFNKIVGIFIKSNGNNK